MLEETDAPPQVVQECSLDHATRDLIQLIFNHDMFSDAMKSLEIGRSSVSELRHLCELMVVLRREK